MSTSAAPSKSMFMKSLAIDMAKAKLLFDLGEKKYWQLE
jgi:hypothetical protein